MFKDILREQQPVVYHTLRNALEHNRLAHAYMFSGPSGTPKKKQHICWPRVWFAGNQASPVRYVIRVSVLHTTNMPI